MDLSSILSAPSPTEEQASAIHSTTNEHVPDTMPSSSASMHQSPSLSPLPSSPPPQLPDPFENQVVQVFFGGSSRTFEKMKLWRDTAAELRAGVPASEAFHRQISFATSYLRTYFAKVENIAEEHDPSLCMQACRGQPHKHGYVCRFCGTLVSSDLHQLKYGPNSRHFINKKCTLQGEDLDLFLSALSTVDQKFMETNSKAETRHAQRQAGMVAAANKGKQRARSSRATGAVGSASTSPASSSYDVTGSRGRSKRSRGSEETSDASPVSNHSVLAPPRYAPFPRAVRTKSSSSIPQSSPQTAQAPRPSTSMPSYARSYPDYYGSNPYSLDFHPPPQQHDSRYAYAPYAMPYEGLVQAGQAQLLMEMHRAPQTLYPSMAAEENPASFRRQREGSGDYFGTSSDRYLPQQQPLAMKSRHASGSPNMSEERPGRVKEEKLEEGDGV